MLKYMLDTNICVYVLKNYPPNLRGRFAHLTNRLCISAITLGELCYGAEKSARRSENLEEVDAFAERIEVLAFSADAARHFGQIRAELERTGTRIGSQDLLIGAHARSEGLTLVTNNRREFDRIPGLTVENWV
jgi:tRNA(fMet)-specific endonuclease VapC